MSAFSLTLLRMNFLSWCCSVLLLLSSSTTGFTARSSGGTNTYHNTPRLRSDGNGEASTPSLPMPSEQRHGWQGCRRYQHDHAPPGSATALHLSFTTEVPIVTDMISTYSYCLKYHYFPTQSMTNAILTLVGDGVAQSQETSIQHPDEENDNRLDRYRDNEIDRKTGNSYDPKRGLVYFFKGLGSGVMWAWWFEMAEVWSVELTQSVLSYGRSSFDAGEFQQSQPAIEFAMSTTGAYVLTAPAQTIRTAINILLEQFLVCPILFSLWDIPVTSVMRGRPMEEFPLQIKEMLVPLLVANGKVWTLVNVVTYNIPLEYRLLFTSAASILSESINSGITSQQIGPPEIPKAMIPALADVQPLSNSIPDIGMDTNIINAEGLVYSAAAMAAVVPQFSASAMNGYNMTMMEL